MKKAVFLDRDGIVNKELGDYILSLEEFTIHPPFIDFLRIILQMGYEAVIITNQGGIAKGRYGHSLVEACHKVLWETIEKEGLSIREAYYCPHHPEGGNCLCRKPSGLMIEKAIARFGYDKSQSIMIGDKQRDVDAALDAGIRGYLLPANPSIEALLSCLPA
jgi:D-glycero-D-manno-heptose 1,7-bisphosphate phosphatase